MEVGEVIQNGGLVIGGAALAKIFDALLTWWKSRQPVEVKQPIDVKGEVEQKPTYMTVKACETRMCEMGGRIDRIADGQQQILSKLDEMDNRSEQRAIAAHNRIEPLVKELAKNIGAVEIIKESFFRSMSGGKK